MRIMMMLVMMIMSQLITRLMVEELLIEVQQIAWYLMTSQLIPIAGDSGGGDDQMASREIVDEVLSEVACESEDDEVSDMSDYNEDVVQATADIEQQMLPIDFKKFRNWLSAPDGGRIDARSAFQHAKQVQKVMDQFDTDHSHRTDLLLDIDTNRQEFLDRYAVERNYRPGTIISHLFSLKHGYELCLLSMKPVAVIRRRINVMKHTVKRWAASYRKDANKRVL